MFNLGEEEMAKKSKKSASEEINQRELYVQEKRHLLELQNVTKIYTTKAGDTAALNGVSLTFPESGMVFITGKSGSGKTTMLNVIGGLDGIDGGEVFVGGKRFSEFTEKEYDSYRNTLIGFIFQEYNLLPDYTIEKNIGIANELQGKPVNKELLHNLLESVDVSKDYAGRNPNQLSGGQKQRIAIVRALIKDPKIIMADEPTGALDSVTGIQVMEELKRLSKDKLVIIVSHDLELAKNYADRIIRLVDGQVVEDVLVSEEQIKSNVYEASGVLNVKSGAELNEKETLALTNAIKNKTKINITDKLTYKRKTKVRENEIPEFTEEIKLVSSKMKYKSAALLGVKSLGVKPARLIFTILLAAIAFAVFGFSDTIASYGRSKVIANLLNTKDYETISVGANYTPDDNDTFKINIGDDAISQVNSQTGYNFRGVYSIYNYVKKGTQNPEKSTTHNVDVKGPGGQTFSSPSVGRAYYKFAVNGMVEFSTEEIIAGTIEEYGYRIIHGEYPTLQYVDDVATGEKVVSEDSLHKVAISKYIAESLVYLTKAHANNYNIFGGQLNSIDELIGKQIRLTNDVEPFTIVGIIDCGVIPEKYEKLKLNNETVFAKAFRLEFDSYLNSTAHKLLFMGEGFVEETRKLQGKATSYYADNLKYNVDYDGKLGPGSQNATSSSEFFNATEYTRDNVILFDDGEYVEGENLSKTYTLKDNEVIISEKNLKHALTLEYSLLDASNNALYERMQNALRDLVYKPSYSDKRNIINELFGAGGIVQDIRKLPVADGVRDGHYIYLNKINEVTGVTETFEYKVVGVYFGLNFTEISGSLTFSPLMMNENDLNEVGAYAGQGEYTRIIGKIGKNRQQNNKLAKLMTSKSGLGLYWFDNNFMNDIENNEELINQLAKLFLYASLFLAAFAIFMLYNYISTSIVSKRQSIGILRALGSGGADVFKMFLTESLVISLINAVVSIILTFVACIAVNYYFINVMSVGVEFAIFGVRQVIMLLAISVVTGVASSIMPIIKISKVKPVDLIRRP